MRKYYASANRPVDCGRRMCVRIQCTSMLFAVAAPSTDHETLPHLSNFVADNDTVDAVVAPATAAIVFTFRQFRLPAGPRPFPCGGCVLRCVATASDSNYCNHTIPSTSGIGGRPKNRDQIGENQLVPMKWKLLRARAAVSDAHRLRMGIHLRDMFYVRLS